jgi:hypothetical protein
MLAENVTLPSFRVSADPGFAARGSGLLELAGVNPSSANADDAGTIVQSKNSINRIAAFSAVYVDIPRRWLAEK